MKSTFKQLLKITAYTTVMALFFSCTPATGGSTTGSGTDTGTGTTTTGTTGGSTTGSGTDTGTGTTTTGATGGSTTGSGTDTGTGTTITGTSGVSFSTTYNDPTLPENIGTDPFKGHTYRNTYSSSTGSSNYGFTFGNNGELTCTTTITSTTTSGTTTISSGHKYSYSYDATTKELSTKITKTLQKVPGSTEYRWYTYSEYINYLLNITRSQLNEMGNTTTYTTYTDEQLRDLIQNGCISAKNQFETINLCKAELDTSNNLAIRQDYYKTAPSSLPDNKNHSVSYINYQNSTTLSFGLMIYQNSTSGVRIGSTSSGEAFYLKGIVVAGTKQFNITNITSNTITAVEFTSSSTGSSTVYSLVSGGVTLLLNYTYALGNDNNLVITVTGSDDTTKDYLRTLLGDSTQTNPSITASSSTYSSTYTLVQ